MRVVATKEGESVDVHVQHGTDFKDALGLSVVQALAFISDALQGRLIVEKKKEEKPDEKKDKKISKGPEEGVPSKEDAGGDGIPSNEGRGQQGPDRSDSVEQPASEDGPSKKQQSSKPKGKARSK